MTETNENAVREGRIIRGVGGIYSVDLDGGATVSCRVRGALRATFSSAARTAGAYHTGSRLDRPLTEFASSWRQTPQAVRATGRRR